MEKNVFEITSTSRHDEYLDIECVDSSAKADLRSWHITINCDEGTVHGILRRSPDTETPFDDGVELPQGMVRCVLKETNRLREEAGKLAVKLADHREKSKREEQKLSDRLFEIMGHLDQSA